MAYSKREVWNKIIKRGRVYLNYSMKRMNLIRGQNGLKGFGGAEDGCIEFVAFEIIDSLTQLRLMVGPRIFKAKHKSIILHSWKMIRNGVKADIDFIYDKSGANFKYKIRTWVQPKKQETNFKMIRWMRRTPSNPLGQVPIRKSSAMVVITQKQYIGFLTPHYEVFYRFTKRTP